MKLSSSYIYLKEARFHAYHGVFPQEQTVGQDYLVSVRCGYNIDAAMQHDMVEVTLDYGALYRLIEREMAVPSQLLEHVAGRIGQSVFSRYPAVDAVDVSVVKENPPMGSSLHGAGVELHLINDKSAG